MLLFCFLQVKIGTIAISLYTVNMIETTNFEDFRGKLNFWKFLSSL